MKTLNYFHRTLMLTSCMFVAIIVSSRAQTANSAAQHYQPIDLVQAAGGVGGAESGESIVLSPDVIQVGESVGGLESDQNLFIPSEGATPDLFGAVSVPESATIVATSLLLFPLGASTLRIVQRKKSGG